MNTQNMPMHHALLWVARRSAYYPFHAPLRQLRYITSRKMAEELAQSQDATTGEEIASTTIPPKGSHPKHNACTSPTLRFLTFRDRS